MRWEKSPAPSLFAPVRSAVIGISMRRASTVPARIATARPSAISSATRNNWSRIGASACEVGCSKNTYQPSLGTLLAAVSTEWPSASVPEASGWPSGVITAATCGNAERSLPISGPLAELASTRPRESTT